jgi:hypothetical protein
LILTVISSKNGISPWVESDKATAKGIWYKPTFMRLIFIVSPPA